MGDRKNSTDPPNLKVRPLRCKVKGQTMKRINTDSDFTFPPGTEVRCLEGTVQREFLTDRPISSAPPGVCDGLAKIVGGHTYAHAAKSDRQDGDELQDRVMDALRKSGLNEGPLVMTKWRDGIDIDQPSYKTMAFVRLLLVAPQPTCDAAGGAGIPLEILRTELHRRATPQPAPEVDWPQDAPPLLHTELLGPDGMRTPSKAELRQAFFGDEQPAPDAMREALKATKDELSWCVGQLMQCGYTFTTTGKVNKAIQDAEAALAAPVPSPDGAVTRESIAQELVLYERWTILDETTRAMIHRAISFILNLPPSATGAADSGSLTHAQAAIERQKNAPPNIDVLAADLVAAGEVEYTGAVEPVAWPTGERGTRSNPSSDVDPDRSFATSPVRVDREALIAAISNTTMNNGAKIEGVLLRSNIERIADAILSLPVQPGAGERQ